MINYFTNDGPASGTLPSVVEHPVNTEVLMEVCWQTNVTQHPHINSRDQTAVTTLLIVVKAPCTWITRGTPLQACRSGAEEPRKTLPHTKIIFPVKGDVKVAKISQSPRTRGIHS